MIDVAVSADYLDLACKIKVHYQVHPRHVALILAHYDGSKDVIDQIEQLTKLPRWQISNIASRCGYRARKEKRNWEAYERDFLVDYYGALSIDAIAKKLNRSRMSIIRKAGRMGLTQLGNQGNFSLRELSNILKVKMHTIRVTWIGHGLTYKRIRNDRAYLFVEKDIVQFFKKHPEAYDWTRLPEKKLYQLGIMHNNRLQLPYPPQEKLVRCNYHLRGSGSVCGYNYWTDLFTPTQPCPACGRMVSGWASEYRGSRERFKEYDNSNASIGYYFEGIAG